jgi:hypothetical protein
MKIGMERYRAFAVAGALVAVVAGWGIIGFSAPAQAQQLNFIEQDNMVFGPVTVMPGQTARTQCINNAVGVREARPQLVVMAIYDALNGTLLATNKGKVLQPGQGDVLEFPNLGPTPRDVYGLTLSGNGLTLSGNNPVNTIIASMQLVGPNGPILLCPSDPSRRR